VSYERELKLELQPASATALARIPQLLGSNLAGQRRVEQLDSVYFDTPRRTLREHGISLRIRGNGKQRLQTIKWLERSKLFDRGESETEVSGKGPDWKAARPTAIAPLLSKKLCRSAKPLFKTRVRRTIYPIATETATIELALDSGSIAANGRSERIRELEFELKSGEPAELFRIARELSKTIPARLCLRSKAERGYELLSGASPAMVKAAEIELSSSTSTADAFRIIARSCLAQIVGNEAGVEAGNPEALHQIRIGLRRLRAAASLFSEIVAGPETDSIKSELRWITQELSPARDLDVYLSQVLGRFREQYKRSGEFRILCPIFERRRAEAFSRAAGAVRSDRYRHLLIELAAWIEAGEWSRSQDETGRANQERSIEQHATEQLARRRKKIVKKAMVFDRLEEAQRHKLRIAVKKFRYAAEFVATVFATKRAKHRRLASLDAAKRIQDSLGAVNDIAVHEKISRDVLDEHSAANPKLARDRAFVAGLVAGQQEAQSAKLIARAAAALDDFRTIKPFWK
jgi:triphosphatase